MITVPVPELVPGRTASLTPATLHTAPGHGRGLALVGAAGARATIYTSTLTPGAVVVTAYVTDADGWPFHVGAPWAVVNTFNAVTRATPDGAGRWLLTYPPHGEHVRVSVPARLADWHTVRTAVHCLASLAMCLLAC